MEILLPSSDEDEIWLFERTTAQLCKRFGHSEPEAANLVRRYYAKFTDPEYCSEHRISVQDSTFFGREESISMADRIHYFEALGNEPNEKEFIQWQRSLWAEADEAQPRA